MEQKLQLIPEEREKARTWRILPPRPPVRNPGIPDESICSQWTMSKRQAQSVMLFDVDYAELADIAERYQSTKTKPVRLISLRSALTDF
jgi:hypothetical protein